LFLVPLLNVMPRRPWRAYGLLALIWLWLVPASALAEAEPTESFTAIVLVAHPDIELSALPRDALRAMFAMRQRTWPGGQAMQVFVLPNRDPVHARFAKEMLAVYPHQLQLAWDRMVFSGMGQAPHRVRDQVDMRERVARTPGALGYLEREYLDESVRVISME
jgi:ABC-type phosphate transport system substrate-binding protein